MKKFLAAIALAFMLLIGDGGSSFTQAANCPPTASYSEMFTALDKNNETVWVANEKFVRFIENLNGLPAGFLSAVMFIELKDGSGFMHIAFTDSCLIAESVFNIKSSDFFSFLERNDFSGEDFARTVGA